MSSRTVKDPEERRREILEAARKMFAEKGFEATSVSDIVKSLGIAQGTFYWYFDSKEDAYHEVAHDYADKRVAWMEDIAARTDLSAVEKLLEVLGSFSPIDEWEQAFVTRIHRPAEAALHDHLMREMSRRLVPLLADVISQGVREGTFKTDYPGEAAAFIVAMGATQSMIDLEELTEDDTKRWIFAFFDFLSHGIEYTGDKPMTPETMHMFKEQGATGESDALS